MRTVETVVLLVALATVVAAFASRLRVPAPSLLVAVGLAVGLLPGAPMVHVPPAVVSLVVLPPLLYAASEELPWRDLRAVWRPVAVLAVGLVLASAAAVAAVAGAVASLSASMAFVLGAVLASTDPVAVSALARRLSLPARVQALVQAESLFNDAHEPGAVPDRGLPRRGRHGRDGRGRASCCTGRASSSSWRAAACWPARWSRPGAIVVRRRITDPVLETVAALITPYAAYLLGETMHVSGVTAVIVAGLVIGARRPKITTARTRLQLHSVYQTVIFVLESVVFSLIGLQLPTLVRALGRSGQWLAGRARGDRDPDRHPDGVGLPAVGGWPAAPRRAPPGLAGPPPWSPGPAPAGWCRWPPRCPSRSPRPAGPPLPQRDLVLVLAAAAIVISLVVQGFTLEPLARLAGFGPRTAPPGPRPRGDHRPAAPGRSGPRPPGRAGRRRRRPRCGDRPAPRRPAGPDRQHPCPHLDQDPDAGTGPDADRAGTARRPHRGGERRTGPALRRRHHQRGHPAAAAAKPGPGARPPH